MERRHRTLESRDVDCNGHGSASLTLVAAGRWHGEAQVVAILVQVQVRGCGELVGLRGRSLDERRRHCRWNSKGVVIVSQAVLERFQGNKLGKLNAQDLGMASQMMNHDLACLLFFSEITTLVETSRVGGIHVEVWWAVQLHHKTTRSGWCAVRAGVRISGFQSDVLNVSERILDLVTGSIVVNVVGHARLVRRVKDNQVHGVLPDASPATNGQGPTGEVRDN